MCCWCKMRSYIAMDLINFEHKASNVVKTPSEWEYASRNFKACEGVAVNSMRFNANERAQKASKNSGSCCQGLLLLAGSSPSLWTQERASVCPSPQHADRYTRTETLNKGAAENQSCRVHRWICV